MVQSAHSPHDSPLFEAEEHDAGHGERGRAHPRDGRPPVVCETIGRTKLRNFSCAISISSAVSPIMPHAHFFLLTASTARMGRRAQHTPRLAPTSRTSVQERRPFPNHLERKYPRRRPGPLAPARHAAPSSYMWPPPQQRDHTRHEPRRRTCWGRPKLRRGRPPAACTASLCHSSATA